MAIKIGDFVNQLMREGQYGVSGTYTGQPTLDLIASLNKRLARVWARADWKWKREPIYFNLVAGTRQYTVQAVAANTYVDRIQDLIPYDPTSTFLQGKPLRERTIRQFYDETSVPLWDGGTIIGTPNYNVGAPDKYCNTGMDANGNWVIVVDPVPNLVSKIGGYAKAILSTIVLADVQANNPIPYFPNDVVLDCVYDGCMSDISRIRGKDEDCTRLDLSFQNKVKMLAGEQAGVATDNTPIVTRMPATVNNLRRRLGRR